MVHLRRGFYDFWVSTQSPLAADVLARIRELYAIEAEIRGHPAEHRQRVRDERSRPIVEALHGWMREHVDKVSAASDLAKAIRYAIRRWPGLAVFLDDGRVEMDSNVVERAIRPSVITGSFCPYRGGGSRPLSMAPAVWAQGARAISGAAS
jgi:transposase